MEIKNSKISQSFALFNFDSSIFAKVILISLYLAENKELFVKTWQK
jgi:hypothetical protein